MLAEVDVDSQADVLAEVDVNSQADVLAEVDDDSQADVLAEVDVESESDGGLYSWSRARIRNKVIIRRIASSMNIK